MSRTLTQILAIPLREVVQAHARLTGASGSSKADAARWLAAEVDAGRLTVADIRRGGPAVYSSPAAPTPKVPAPAKTDTRLDAIAQAASRPDASSAQLSTEVASLRQALAEAKAEASAALAGAVTAQTKAAQTIESRITTLAAAVQRHQPDDAAAQTRAEIARAIQPLLARIVTPQAAAQVAQVVAQPTGQVDAQTMFGIDARDHRGRPLMFQAWGNAEAPAVDSHHIWTESTLRFLALAEATGRNVWLAGPAGVGKTQTAQQWAARAGRMFRRFVFTRYATADDFLGATGISNGDTRFAPGPVLQAYATPGSICLLDEPGVGNPGAMAVLNGLLEGAAQVAYADQVWLRAPGTLFIGADNSTGQGDTGGRFAGVQQMNTAFMDRFPFVVPMSYLDHADECAALVRHTGCTEVLADHVISAFSLARAKVTTGDLIDPPTFRQAIALVQAFSVLPPAEAWRVVVAARQPIESEVALAALYATAINEHLIEQEAA